MSNIIDWDEAMEQCGDDEEFLRELLGDLRTEVGQQITKIEDTFQLNPPDKNHRIMRAAHVVKGAASNLMCYDLRDTSAKLEAAANQQVVNSDSIVQQHYADMKGAFDHYNQFLESIGV